MPGCATVGAMKIAAAAIAFLVGGQLQAQNAASPLTPQEQAKTFALAPGFTIELVAADPDLAKVVDVSFDDAGRMWAVTAVEYPLDANETPGVDQLYASGGRDRVLVFDTPCAQGRQVPRTFADKLAMPMSVLAIKGGVLVAQGPEIFRLSDSDGDGRADKREVVLDGFGIQDSHLMPHRMLRGPGEWIYVMQGAFNSSRVRTKSGAVVAFDQCKVGRFKADGSRFEVVGTGLNNIWGFVIDSRGGMWIQEANDLGYPVVPFYLGASYPGIGDHRARPYSPMFPPLSDFAMGGTGLSGLALSEDPRDFPEPYGGAMIIANPIARSVQAVRASDNAGLHELEKLSDLIASSDPWFRPIAVHFGPDGCLYIVDWYNGVISHNEVPRTDPGRDKSHGRIWRVRHESQAPRVIPDMTRATGLQLLAGLLSPSAWEARAAWHQIVDRRLLELTPQLEGLLRDERASLSLRLLALWSLEGLGQAKPAVDARLVANKAPELRREALRALGESRPPTPVLIGLLSGIEKEPSDAVRRAAIAAVDLVDNPDSATLGLLLSWVRATSSLPTASSEGRQRIRELEQRYVIEFERSLIRAALEDHGRELEIFLTSPVAANLSLEARALAALALDPSAGALQLAAILARLSRAPSTEEIVVLAARSNDPGVSACFEALLASETSRDVVLSQLLEVRDRLRAQGLEKQIARAARARLALANDKAARDLCVQLTAAFALRELEPEVSAIAESSTDETTRAACVRALTEIESSRVELFEALATGAMPGGELQRACATALTESKDPRATASLVALWPQLSLPLRQRALETLSNSRALAQALLAAVEADEILPSELDGRALGRLTALFSGDPRLVKLERALAGRLKSVLRLDGGDAALETRLTLDGAFTLEAWVNLDAGIDNQDAVLGARGGADFNFADGRFRLYAGAEHGDAIIASKPVLAGTWTHVAITRDNAGELKLFLNGELDPATCRPTRAVLENLDVGVAVAAGGSHGALCDVRVWSLARSTEQIGSNFRRDLSSDQEPQLMFHAGGSGPWGKLVGAATIERTLDAPVLLSAAQAREEQAKFAHYRDLARRPGEVTRGRELFVSTCLSCHSLGSDGSKIGPPLDGVGRRESESLLRAVLTPSAAVESGYRLLRVELDDGAMLDGLLASQDEQAVVLRRQGREDTRLERSAIRRLWFDARSVMPDGQLESLAPADVSALFAYLATLR